MGGGQALRRKEVMGVSGPRKEDPVNPYAALALVGQLGFVIAAPIVAGVMAGVYLDKKLGTSGLILVPMVLVGLAGGLLAAYRLIRKAVR